MKITPIEIRQHTFEKAMRGYRTEDVDAFLVSLSQEWERVIGEHKMLKMQLELAEKELGKLKEVEMTLFRTLKTAEDTSTQITDQATKAAEEHIAQAQQRADELLADTRKRTALMVQDAENQTRYIRETIVNDLQSIEHDLRALERHKDNLILQVRTLAGNAMDSIDRFEKKFSKQALRDKIGEVTTQVQEGSPLAELPMDAEVPAEPQQPDALPALIDRSEDVPEAIPVSETTIDGLNEAIAHEQETVEAPVMDHTEQPAATDTEQNAAQPESAADSPLVTAPASEAEPAEVAHTTTEPKRQQPGSGQGGSFFDDI